MKVFWTREAQEDVHQAFTFISLDKPDAAERVVARLTEAGEKLGLLPHWGRAREGSKLREVAVPGLPYVLVYEVSDEAVTIARVMHGARRR
ncbi:MAG: type II toxin-antitoxin system RelE/ParE family toxin [Micropepsaceae bacterium]